MTPHSWPSSLIGAPADERAPLARAAAVSAVAGDVLTLCPPLIISEAELDELFDRLTRALDKTHDWVVRERIAEA